jgi:hypothetical protein
MTIGHGADWMPDSDRWILEREPRLTASAAASLGGQPPVTSIVQLWPGMPTWFIPESFAGFLLYGLLTAAGVYMVLAGNEGERIWKSF